MPRVRGRNGPIGRHRELDAARDLLLANDHSRGVQLTGPGGIGKTAIARQLVAELHADDRPCAVIDRHLHPAIATARVARALPGRSAWLRRATTDDERITRLAASICDEPLLLVLDGLDRQLSPATGQFRDRGVQHLVTQLVRAAEVGEGRLIVTSRCPVDALNGTLPVLPLTALGGSELDELVGAWPRVIGLLDDLPLVVRHAIGGHPRLVELCDAVIRLGRPARQRLHRELGSDVDHAASPLRDLILRVIVDRLDDRSWELLSHLAVSTMAMTTTTLARALGTSQHDAVRQVAQELAGLRIVVAVGPDEWMLDAWTSSGIRRLESDLITASERCLRVAAARHTPDRVGVGLDDAEESVRNLLGGGHLDLAVERGCRLGELLAVDGQQIRAVTILSELWEVVPSNRADRQSIADLIQRIHAAHERGSARSVPTPTAPDETIADDEDQTIAETETETETAASAELEIASHAEDDGSDLTSDDIAADLRELVVVPDAVDRVRTTLTVTVVDRPEADELLHDVETLGGELATGTADTSRFDELESLLERLDQLDLDPAQTARLLRVIDEASSLSI